jgi:hypothetical protein
MHNSILHFFLNWEEPSLSSTVLPNGCVMLNEHLFFLFPSSPEPAPPVRKGRQLNKLTRPFFFRRLTSSIFSCIQLRKMTACNHAIKIVSLAKPAPSTWHGMLFKVSLKNWNFRLRPRNTKSFLQARCRYSGGKVLCVTKKSSEKAISRDGLH